MGFAKHYWKSQDELANPAEYARVASEEFPDSPLRSIESAPDRRAFLKAAGFAFGAAALAGCSKTPAQKAMPLLAEPEGVLPGRPLYYASTCGACSAGCGVIVKVRDGRPIKLEGNPDHPLSRGGLCAVGQASLLGLYDSYRFRGPLMTGKPCSWGEADAALRSRFDEIRAKGGSVRFLTGTITSPAARALVGDFLAGFRDARHVLYDPLSCSATAAAHERTHGVRAIPHYRFDRADVIVSFDADFLGTWISPVEFTAAYSQGRNSERKGAKRSYHVQFEGRMSLTGTKADRRIAVTPSEAENALACLYARMAGLPNSPADSRIAQLAKRLQDTRGRSLVVCGLDSLRAQILTNAINHLLGNYGATLDLDRPSNQRLGDDGELSRLLGELNEGRIAALIVHEVNPAYDIAAAEAVRKAGLIVSLAERPDETTAAAHFVCPVPHYLEDWTDAEPTTGLAAITQPAIRPLGNTRPFLETLAAWTGAPKPAQEVLRARWQGKFDWEKALEDGFASVEPSKPAKVAAFNAAPVEDALRSGPAPAAAGTTLVLYAKPQMLDGRHAYNPWLQELPDPITKVAWDNYAAIAPAFAGRLGVKQGDMVRIESGAVKLEVPVVVQPGQHERVVAVAIGYGSELSRRFREIGPQWIDARPSVGEDGLVGKNTAPFRFTSAVAVTKIPGTRDLACTQDHYMLAEPAKLTPPGALEPRDIVQEIAPAALPAAPKPTETHEDLWPPDHVPKGHRWAMAVDLDACTGCSACVIACQAENNIPVVGKDEVRRRRAMHWMRIDRYYSTDAGDISVAHQPMFCAQCAHAPCETVCPVLATAHSSEGLNQQIYNRCVGTRYCANNCPYKVRRFNWFEYPREDTVANLVLNPDVAVRSRGVMEKCTFCVQRIQEAKIEARREGRPVKDGEIQTACQQSCPAGAIVFGDANDPNSRVSRLMRSGRAYRVLEELNVQPSVSYLKLVRERRPEGGERNG